MGPVLIRRITEIVSKPRRDCIYEILGHLTLRLCVDVGAAAGDTTRRISSAGGEDTRVVAFEPFPGNHRYFHEATSGLGNVVLIKKAVGDHVGLAEFVVPSVVRGTESGWEDFAGYSSVGFLSSPGSTRGGALGRRLAWALRSAAAKARRRLGARRMMVETTTIDREFGGERIDFMKVDVQGGECRVLIGSKNALRHQRIGIMYMEWSGDMEPVERLARSGYWIWDSTYVVGPRVHCLEPFEEMGLRLLEELRLSTGQRAYELLLGEGNLGPHEIMREVEKRRLGWIQTDLIAVSESALPSFLHAVEKYQEIGAQS